MVVVSMSGVDKFGRSNVKMSTSQDLARGIFKGSPGIGFKLTHDGNYDMQLKQIVNVGAPIYLNDAATKIYVDNEINHLAQELIRLQKSNDKLVDALYEHMQQSQLSSTI